MNEQKTRFSAVFPSYAGHEELAKKLIPGCVKLKKCCNETMKTWT
jgi:hypothetical protein